MNHHEERRRVQEALEALNGMQLSEEERLEQELAESKFGKLLGSLVRRIFAGSVQQPNWLLENILPEHSIGSVFGPPNGGKSHLVIDLATAMVTGQTEWNGVPLKPGPVLYFAESTPHIEARFLGYNEKYGGQDWDAPGRFPLHIFPPPGISLNEFHLFRMFMERLPYRPKLIVFDTFMACFRSEKGDNDSETVANLMDRLQQEILPLMDDGVIVLIDHSSRHSQGSAIKGSISKDGAYDWTINVQFKKDFMRTIARLDKDRWQKHGGKAHWAGQTQLVEVDFLAPGCDPDDPVFVKDTVGIQAWEPWSDEDEKAQEDISQQQKNADRAKLHRDLVIDKLREMHVGRQKIFLSYEKNSYNRDKLPELKLHELGIKANSARPIKEWILKNTDVLCHIDYNSNDNPIGIIITGINDSPF